MMNLPARAARVNPAHWWGVGVDSLSSGVRWSTVLSGRVPDRTAIGAQEGVKADYAGVPEGSIPPASILLPRHHLSLGVVCWHA